MWPFKPKPVPEGEICPMLRGPCIKARCKLWLHISGQDPQHERKTIDMWDCALRWTPILTIDTARQVSGVHKALNSLRNEMVESSEAGA